MATFNDLKSAADQDGSRMKPGGKNDLALLGWKTEVFELFELGLNPRLKFKMKLKSLESNNNYNNNYGVRLVQFLDAFDCTGLSIHPFIHPPTNQAINQSINQPSPSPWICSSRPAKVKIIPKWWINQGDL